MSKVEVMSSVWPGDARVVRRCASGFDWNTINTGEALYFGDSKTGSLTGSASGITIGGALAMSVASLTGAAATGLTVATASGTITGEAHGFDVTQTGTMSSGDSMVAGNFVCDTTGGTAGTWGAGIYSKVMMGATKTVNGYVTGGEFEIAIGATNSNLMDFGVIVLNYNSAATSSIANTTHGAYIMMREYSSGGQPCRNALSLVDATPGSKSDTTIFTSIGTTASKYALRIEVGTTTYWLLATDVAPSGT